MFLPPQQSCTLTQCWWWVSRSCSWRVRAEGTLVSDWTPSARWSCGRGTRCRWTGARGSPVWTWRWVCDVMALSLRWWNVGGGKRLSDSNSTVHYNKVTVLYIIINVSVCVCAAVSVHERPGVPRGQLLPRPHQRPRPLPLPDLPQEEEALP